jgi:hypothetical protein
MGRAASLDRNHRRSKPLEERHHVPAPQLLAKRLSDVHPMKLKNVFRCHANSAKRLHGGPPLFEICNDLTTMPSGPSTPTSRMGFGPAFAQVRCDHRSEMVHPAPDRIIGDHDPAFRQQIFSAQSNLPDPARQVAILVTGAHFRAAYEIYAHVAVAEHDKLPDAKLATIVAAASVRSHPR